jgi:NAD(P)-dependent dehydrogenase (short-subunit alcohol dehydrogenase family)
VNARRSARHEVRVGVDDPLGVGGSIVNVSSQASLVALAGTSPTAPRKPRWNITRVSRWSSRYGIRVNSVNPTVVMTPMSATGPPEIEEPFLRASVGAVGAEDDRTPIVPPRRGASMISGVCPPIDGGFTAQ